MMLCIRTSASLIIQIWKYFQSNNHFSFKVNTNFCDSDVLLRWPIFLSYLFLETELSWIHWTQQSSIFSIFMLFLMMEVEPALKMLSVFNWNETMEKSNMCTSFKFCYCCHHIFMSFIQQYSLQPQLCSWGVVYNDTAFISHELKHSVLFATSCCSK